MSPRTFVTSENSTPLFSENENIRDRETKMLLVYAGSAEDLISQKINSTSQLPAVLVPYSFVLGTLNMVTWVF